MSLCIELAKDALQKGDPPVGCILLHDDEVIGTGIESGKSTDDITNHAEILAVRNAIQNGHKDKLSNSTLYTTHEPCIMCSYLVRHHKIPHIVYGVSVDYIGGSTSRFDVLCTEEVPKWGHKPSIIAGILKEECDTLNAQFLERLKK